LSEQLQLLVFAGTSVAVAYLTWALSTKEQTSAQRAQENANLLKREETLRRRIIEMLDGLDAAIWEGGGELQEGKSGPSNLTYVSAGASRLTGYAVEQLRNPELLSNIIFPEDRERRHANYQEGIASGADFEVDYRIVNAEGNIRWARDSVRVIGQGQGQRIRIVTTDIAALKRIESNLRVRADAGEALESSLDYDTTLEKIPEIVVPNLADHCLIYLWSTDGLLRLATSGHLNTVRGETLEKTQKTFSASDRSPVVGVVRSGKPLLLPTDQDRSQDRSEDRPENGVQQTAEAMLLRSLNAHSAIIVPLAVSGRTLGVMIWLLTRPHNRYDTADLALATDLARRITIAIENARRYKASEQNVEARDKFLAILGHELRNPLSAISNAVKLSELKPDEEERLRYNSIIARQTRHMAKLIDDLLDVSRVTAGKITLQRQALDLRRTAADCVEACRAEIDRKLHRVTLSIADDPVTVDADPLRVEQMLTNLLVNSIKYTPSGGTIEIAVRKETEHGIITVRDSGIGIPADMLDHIFEPFARVETSVGRSSGLGLGLSLVRQLAALHSGTAEASSRGVGEGSEFTLRLPLVKGEAALTAHTNGKARDPGARRVLIVEDDADIRETLRDLLKQQGHEVATAGDGPAALQMARLTMPEIALVDIGLPGFDGYEVARRLRAQQLEPPVLVALTGFGQPDDRRRALEAGFDRHFVKPINTDELLKLVLETPAAERVVKS
jgi:PAS domain S-box-containing protein